MPWTTVMDHWPNLLNGLSAHFRHLDTAALERFRGDRAQMVRYLAQTHDLTQAEAGDALDDWLMLETLRAQRRTAA